MTNPLCLPVNATYTQGRDIVVRFKLGQKLFFRGLSGLSLVGFRVMSPKHRQNVKNVNDFMELNLGYFFIHVDCIFNLHLCDSLIL